MRSEKRLNGVLNAISSFCIFFLLIAVVITCCLVLFVSVLQGTIGHKFTQSEISAAAKATMLCALLLSALITAVDTLRRKLTVERPVKRITEACERMIAGDFSVRIKPTSKLSSDDHFNAIIDCINKMAEELSGVETLRTDFIADVSHEMKTPLSVIQNYGKLLQAPRLSEEERTEYATAITDASHRLSEMVTNILKLNRLENQKIYPKFAAFDLGEQLCEVLLRYETVWERKNIEIETELEEGITVTADEELLSLVWSNLFSNAFKFTKEGGKVSLRLTADGEYATVTVTDTGCGISPEVGAHIFEKFYQGDPSRAREGNGLGLALVRRIIDILEGEISVNSELGVGSTFTVKIRRENYGLEKDR